jgi:hypothetical protein
MRRITCILIFSIVACHPPVLNGQECKKLQTGKYRIKPNGFSDFELIIADDNFTTIAKDGKQSKGKITWTSDCTFVLNSEDFGSQADTTSFVYKIHRGWGEPCYEVIGTKKYRTTWTGNLHVTTSEGRITRLNN